MPVIVAHPIFRPRPPGEEQVLLNAHRTRLARAARRGRVEFAAHVEVNSTRPWHDRRHRLCLDAEATCAA
jgi:hypothetical protein